MIQSNQKIRKLSQKKPVDMMRFASLGTQFLVSIGITAWLGLWLDKKFAFTTPIFVWLLPLLTIIGLLVAIIKEASQK